MITLEKHLNAHQQAGTDSDYRIRCGCGKKFDLSEHHSAHIAATWREARTVRTFEALEALPHCALVLPHGDTTTRAADDLADDLERWPEDAAHALPALIVWIPEDGTA